MYQFQFVMKTNEEIEEYLNQVNLNKFGNSYDEACLFYFGLLREIDLKIITTEIEIQNVAITMQRNRKQTKNVPAKIRQQAPPKRQSPEKNEKIYPFACKIKGCAKGFNSKFALDSHEMLRHKMQLQDWMSNRAFNIQIRDSSSEIGRRGNRTSI